MTPDKTVSVGTEVAAVPRPPAGGAQFAPGTVVAGRYRIIGLLGAGGMGEVFHADDLKLGQPVALKFLAARLAHQPVLLGRLHEEVRLGRLVAHPNVCRIYDIAEWEGAHFVAMEYVEGEDLSRLLKRIGRLAHDKAVDIARGVAAGLMAAHAKGVLHRDLKPANVMIDGQGESRIMDFGLALSAGDSQPGVLAGTPAYVAPEQLEGEAATVQSDLYALGLVMYELVTGHRVHEARSFNERVSRLTDEIAKPSRVVRDVHPAVEAIILRCLAADPAARPRSAREVIEALPGDPLAAAMAAGQTPSPRLVAAARSVGSLKPPVAWSLMAAIALELAFAFYAFRAKGVFGMLHPKPPEFLAERAAEIRDREGLPAQEFRSTGWIGDLRHLAWIASTDDSPGRWERLAKGIAPLSFWVRYEPKPVLRDGVELAPTMTEPPQAAAGASTIAVDPKGRLLSLKAVPSASWPARQPDWGALFEAAGLDPARFTPAAPRALPPAYADARGAWNGTHPDDGTPIRVEAAAWRGTPVFFQIAAPWDDAPDRTSVLPFAGSAGRAYVLAMGGTLLAFAVFGVFLAWRNLRMRRGDRAGATRMAVVLFALQMIAVIGMADHELSAAHEVTIVLKATATSLLWTSGYFLVYLGLEPFVRRRWPDRLIGWARLLSGNWRDPMVGRDVLIGVAGGLGHVGIALLPYVLGIAPILMSMPMLRNAFAPFAGIAGNVHYGVVQGLTVMIALMALTIVLRKRRLAALGLFALLFIVFQFGSSDVRMLPVFAAGAALCAFIAVRFGLLAIAVYGVTFNLLLSTVLPAEVSWYTMRALVAPLFVVAVAAWALRASLGPSADRSAIRLGVAPA
jgi:serine/threonine-protein kinase